MAIFIEGCDLSGKTTFGKKLAKRLGVPFVWLRDRGPNMSSQWLKQAAMRDAIVDRWWPSEWIYRTAEGKVPDINLCEMWSANLLAETYGALYIQLEPDDIKVGLRYVDRGDEEKGLTEVLLINAHYQLRSHKWWKYLPKAQMINPKMPDVVDAHNSLQQRSKSYQGWGIGSLNPDVLFVSEAPPAKTGAVDNRPYVTTHLKGRSKILFQLLDAANLTPKDVHIHNTFSISGHPMLTRATLGFLTPRKIIALGDDAENYMTSLGVECDGVMESLQHMHDEGCDIANGTQWIREMTK